MRQKVRATAACEWRSPASSICVEVSGLGFNGFEYALGQQEHVAVYLSACGKVRFAARVRSTNGQHDRVFLAFKSDFDFQRADGDSQLLFWRWTRLVNDKAVGSDGGQGVQEGIALAGTEFDLV